jgi:conserved hypothetical protein
MKKLKYLQYALHAAVLGGLIYAGMKYIDGDQFARAIRQFDWHYAPLVCLLGIASFFIKGWRFARLMRTLQNASRGMLVRVYLAGQACAMLPGGGAARAGMLKQAGIPVAETAAPLAMSSLTDQILFVLCTLVAAFWFETARRPLIVFLVGLALVSILLGIEAWRTWVLRLIEQLMDRFHWQEHWREFLDALKTISTPRLLIGSVANTAVAFACLLLALHLTLRGVGVSVPFPHLLLAFALPTMLGRISALPGGVGVTEAGMIGVLGTIPNVSPDQAAAAVTVFRLGTVFFTALVGGLIYLFAWRGVEEARHVRKGDAPVPAAPATDSELRVTH